MDSKNRPTLAEELIRREVVAADREQILAFAEYLRTESEKARAEQDENSTPYPGTPESEWEVVRRLTREWIAWRGREVEDDEDE